MLSKESIRNELRKIVTSKVDQRSDTEIYCKSSESSRLSFDSLSIKQNSASIENGHAIRIWDENGYEHFYHASGEDENIVQSLQCILPLKRTIEKARIYGRALPSKRAIVQNVSIFCPKTAQLSDEEKEVFVTRLLQRMKDLDKDVMELKNGDLIISESYQLVMNSRGFEGDFRRTSASLSLEMSVKGMKFPASEKYNNNSIETEFIFASSSVLDLDIDRICTDLHSYPFNRRRGAVHGSGYLAKGISMAVFSPSASSTLLRCLVPHLIATNKDRWSSFGIVTESRTTTKIPTLSKYLTVIDDPMLEKGLNSAPFDGAGFPVEKTVVIDSGNFMKPLESLIRVSYTDLPIPGSTNIYIQPGEESPDNLVSRITKGLYIISLQPFSIAGFDANISAVGFGLPIHNGALVPDYRSFYLSEDIFDLLRRISAAGNDLKFDFHGGCYGAPSLLVDTT